ncbi:MAG TPA: LysR family transcriptional regulator [Acetobacteraceae bacterium]|nr:LysR family transcriptional regulator [Acetobacteraceae bacterium]
MDQIAAMRMFVRVVESGSFSAVARTTGVGQPAVSKQISALETHLGAQLLRRTSRSLSLTEAGQDFYESAVRLIDDLEAAESRVGRGQSAPSGLVRVTVAPVFGRLLVVPRLPAFFARYPDIAVETIVTDRSVNLVEEGVDLAIHNGALVDSTAVVRRIAMTPVVTVASPDYLAAHGEPSAPSELEGHSCVIFAPQGAPRAWGFKGKFGEFEYRPHGRFRTNDADQIRAGVLSGLGLAHAPGWLFAREIASGQVRRVLCAYEPDPLPISAVHPAGRRLPAKVRVFIDFLAGLFAQDANLTLRDMREETP